MQAFFIDQSFGGREAERMKLKIDLSPRASFYIEILRMFDERRRQKITRLTSFEIAQGGLAAHMLSKSERVALNPRSEHDVRLIGNRRRVIDNRDTGITDLLGQRPRIYGENHNAMTTGLEPKSPVPRIHPRRPSAASAVRGRL
jgi:hypothetical protein